MSNPITPSDVSANAQPIADTAYAAVVASDVHRVCDSLFEDNTSSERSFIARLAKAEGWSPTAMVDNVRAAMATLRGGKVAAPTSAGPVTAPTVAPSNTGAPRSGGTSGVLPLNPLEWPSEVVSRLTPQQFRDAVFEFEVKSGKRPFAHLRRENKNRADANLASTIETIARALGRN